jgi:hypothetical protein
VRSALTVIAYITAKVRIASTTHEGNRAVPLQLSPKALRSVVVAKALRICLPGQRTSG